MTLVSKLSLETRKQRHIFSLWTTFSFEQPWWSDCYLLTNMQHQKYYLFQCISFASICNQSEWTQVCIRTFEKKQIKKWALERKLQKKNKLFHLKVCNALGKTLYCIRKHFIMWDVQPQENESGCLWQAAKTNKKTSIFGTNNCSKIRTCIVLNTMYAKCNFEISKCIKLYDISRNWSRSNRPW